MRDHIPSLISEFISRGLTFPHFNRNQPFWIQIGNPERLSDIGDFYKSYDRIILDQIEVNYFHYRLKQLRKEKFLKFYLRAKFNDRKNPQGADSFSGKPDPVRLFFDYVEREDLEALKSFIQGNQFSDSEKTLVAIFLIHTKRFSNQIMDFIKDLSLDVNQELKNEAFIYEKNFDFLERGTVLTSLAHELLITGDPVLTDRLLESENMDWTARNFLGETFIHFFIRSDVLNNRLNLKTQIDLMEKLLDKLSFLFKEKDALGLNSFMLAFQSNRFMLMKLSLEFVKKLPLAEQKTLLASRDNYGRNLIDILFHNGNTDKAASGFDWPQYIAKEMEKLSIDTRGRFYVNESKETRPRQINVLPYVRLSSFFWPYREYFKEKSAGAELSNPNLLYPEKLREEVFGKKDSESIQNVLGEIVRTTDVLENLRQKTFSALMVEPSILSIISAIQKKDKKALTDLAEMEKKYLALFIRLKKGDSDYPSQSLREQSERLFYDPEQASFLTHFLNEAIINNSLPAVEYLLENYFDANWFKHFVRDFADLEPKNLKDQQVLFFVLRYTKSEGEERSMNFLIDPLSLALFVYASLPPYSEQKESAGKIIRLLSNYQDPGSYSKAVIRSSPMNWALGLGLLDEVKFFHEEKNVEIPEKLFIDVEGSLMAVDTVFALEINSFVNLRSYVTKNLEEAEFFSECHSEIASIH